MMKNLLNWFLSLFNSKLKLKEETRIISNEVAEVINSITEKEDI
jgi:hypothetical protein